MREGLSIIFIGSDPRRIVLREVLKKEYSLEITAVDEKNAIAKVVKDSKINYSKLNILYANAVPGCLGIIYVGDEPFLGVIIDTTPAATIDNETVYCIENVNFISLISDKYDTFESEQKNNALFQGGSTSSTVLEEKHPLANLIKLFCTGTFYLSKKVDLTNRLQNKWSESKNATGEIFSGSDNILMFSWNGHLLENVYDILIKDNSEEKSLLVLNDMDILVTVIRGCVKDANICIGEEYCKLLLISRLASNRVGTRMLSRGVDDDGNVSNCVESEFRFYINDFVFSLVQIRGSVPVFWEQKKQQNSITHKVAFTRSIDATFPAFNAHFEKLMALYNKVLVVNLLGSKPGTKEKEMRDRFYQMFSETSKQYEDKLFYLEFDYNSLIRTGNLMLQEFLDDVKKHMKEFSWFCMNMKTGEVISKQEGVIRSNCMDCLDRTNVIQCHIARAAVEIYLDSMNLDSRHTMKKIICDTTFSMWIENGDFISKIYTGTRALKSSHITYGKQTVFGYLNDVAKSMGRLYLNNFRDKERNQSILTLLGRNTLQKTPNRDNLAKQRVNDDQGSLISRDLILLVGTWNVNGKEPEHFYVKNWLFSDQIQRPNLCAIGVQETVDLAPGRYIYSDPEKMKDIWEKIIKESLENIYLNDYILLSSSVTGSTSIYIFVLPSVLSGVRNVKISSFKTGIGGIAANKGAIGVSLDLHGESLCFVTSHFTSGSAYIAERNGEYRTINEVFEFGLKKIKDHEKIFWFGDLNYRTDTKYQEAINLINTQDLAKLELSDQLTKEKNKQAVFEGYEEGKLSFPPTYKFYQNTYSSDKDDNSTPSWTDRILFQGQDISLLEYCSSNIRNISDHRPVRAIFCLKLFTPAESGTSRSMTKSDSSKFSSKSVSYPQDVKHFSGSLINDDSEL